MKICFIVHTFDKRDRGGVLRVVSQLANLLVDDYDLSIISFGKISENAYELNSKIRLTSLNMEKYNTGFYNGIKKVEWFKQAYTKIHPYLENDTIWITSSPPISLLFSFFKIRNKNLKVIGCDHTSTVYKKHFIIQKVRNSLISKLNVMIGLNPQDTEYYRKNGINSVCIPNGIDLESIHNQHNEKKYLIYVGRFNEEKQPFKAIDLFLNSDLYHSNIKFKMYGHGEFENEVNEYINKNDYAKKIVVIKGETDPDVIYKDAFALILTSKLEGFPVVLLEAISRNIPCLTFKIPYGPINMIKDGENGYFIDEDVRNFNAICGSIDMIDVSKIQYTIKNYDIKHIVEKWHNLLNDENFV